MRALVLIPCLLLCACGDDPVAQQAPPTVYHLDTVELGKLLEAKDPDALAHIPVEDRAKAAQLSADRLRGLSVALARTYVVRLTLETDGHFALTLREQATSGAWANTDAKGTWRKDDKGLELHVTEQSGIAGLDPVLHLPKTERGYRLKARGRVFPLKEFAL